MCSDVLARFAIALSVGVNRGMAGWSVIASPTFLANHLGNSQPTAGRYCQDMRVLPRRARNHIPLV